MIADVTTVVATILATTSLVVVLLGLELTLILLLLLLNLVFKLEDFGQFELLPRTYIHFSNLNL